MSLAELIKRLREILKARDGDEILGQWQLRGQIELLIEELETDNDRSTDDGEREMK